MPERVAYPVVHRVAQNRGRAYHRPEDEDVERVVRQRGDRRRREDQRVSGQERSDHQPGLAEDDQEHHQVCPHVVCAHKRLQVLVQVHEEINQPVQSKNLLASSNQVPILAYRPCPFNGGSGPELPCRWTCCRISPPGSGRHRMIRGEKTEQPRRRLVSAVNNPRLMVSIMFVCMWLVAILAVQRNHLLGVDAPKSRLLTLGGFLTGSARALGISRLSSAVTSEFYAVLIAVLFLSYIWALVLVARGKATMSRGFIIGASVALCLWVLFITPLYAKDLFNYASYGKMLSFHGANPYLHGAADFPRDPVLPYISWKHAISVYGPLFTYLSALITLIARQGAIANIFAFKLVGFAFFLGSLFVVDSLARRMFPSRRAFILVAVAWNPLVIIHLVGVAHNDLIMLFLILTAFLLYRQEKPVWALFSCALAVMIKTTAVFVLIPMLVLFLKQNSRWTPVSYT